MGLGIMVKTGMGKKMVSEMEMEVGLEIELVTETRKWKALSCSSFLPFTSGRLFAM